MLVLGKKCRMELNIALDERIAKGQREEKLWRNTLKHERGIVRKTKPCVERRVTHQHTSIGAHLAKFGKATLHERPPDTTALPLGFDRNWAKPIPTSSTVTDGYWRERHMPDDAARIFGDERDAKGMICSQGADDEVLRLMAVRMRQKSVSSDLLNGVFV